MLARKKGKIYMRAEYARMRESFNKLREVLSEEELNKIEKASKEFRKRFKIR